MTQTPIGVSRIETHTIDFIPESERHGKPSGLFTLWFGANSVIVSIVTAAALVGAGMSFVWSVVAIVIGFGIGSFLSAFHSAQGPTLGVPQMIQSRAQFGFLGGIIPMIIAEINYLIFFAAAPAICGLLIHAVWGLNTYAVAIIVTAITFVLALFGYDVTHRVAKYLSVAAVIVFGVFSVLVIAHVGIPNPQPVPHQGFELGLFLGGISIALVYAAGYAPYIADYSRYLPAKTSATATALYTYSGILLSSLWLFILGAYLVCITGFSEDVLGSIIGITDAFSPVFTGVFVLVIVAIQILQGSLSMYAGGNTAMSIYTTFRRSPTHVSASLKTRLAALCPFAVLCLIAVIAYSTSFTTAFTHMLSVVLIVLMPWSAINLADYYLVRRGHYDIDELCDPDGVYGRVNVAGLISFVVGVAAALLFADLGFFQGPVATLLDGGDISWLVAIVVSAGCYVPLARRALARERRSESESGPGEQQRADGESVPA